MKRDWRVTCITGIRIFSLNLRPRILPTRSVAMSKFLLTGLVFLSLSACEAKKTPATGAVDDADDSAIADVGGSEDVASSTCIPYCNSATCDDGCGGTCEGKACHAPGCTIGGVCQAGVCANFTTTQCNDGNPCTDDKCDGASGVCLYTANSATCDDGSDCTANDACGSGICAGKMTCPSCGDGVCDSEETAFNCAEDCGFWLQHLGGSCSTPGLADGCAPGFFCVARSVQGGGNVCVSDAQTWPAIPNVHPESDFTVVAGISATDKRTGLMWSVQKLGKMLWTDALTACTQFTAGDFHDWRLPTRGELISLGNSAKSGKANQSATSAPIDIPDVGSSNSVFWTSVYFWNGNYMMADDLAVKPAPFALTVDFGGGYALQGGYGVGISQRIDKFFVHCVRDAAPSLPDASTPTTTDRFVLQDKGVTVLDRRSGLHWQRDFSPTMAPEVAFQWCKNQSGLPGDGWRAPTLGEVIQLIELQRSLPYPSAPQLKLQKPNMLLDPLFTPTASKMLWTNTPIADYVGTYYLWADGLPIYDVQSAVWPSGTTGAAIRCVR